MKTFVFLTSNFRKNNFIGSLEQGIVLCSSLRKFIIALLKNFVVNKFWMIWLKNLCSNFMKLCLT